MKCSTGKQNLNVSEKQAKKKPHYTLLLFFPQGPKNVKTWITKELTLIWASVEEEKWSQPEEREKLEALEEAETYRIYCI